MHRIIDQDGNEATARIVLHSTRWAILLTRDDGKEELAEPRLATREDAEVLLSEWCHTRVATKLTAQ
jgi:hypothetical protein